MTRRRTADDCPGRGTPCRALTNRSVARSEKAKTQSDAGRNYDKFFSHDADLFAALNRTRRRMLRRQSQDSLYLTEPVLGIYKYVLCTDVQD
jgi:hypothetical protein